MKFQKAESDWNALRERGLNPTFDDAITLNALGLKWKAAGGKAATTSMDYLPRVAKISERIAFRQPTIGHEVWLEKVERLTEPTFETELAVKAFALSRQASELPDPEDPKSITEAVETFARECADHTHEQLYAAIDYVIHGASQCEGVLCPLMKTEDEERAPDGSEDEDWKECVALGVMFEGRAVLWGITQKELESMTRRQADDLIHRAYVFQKVETSDPAEYYRDGYYTKLDEITARLEKELKDGK